MTQEEKEEFEKLKDAMALAIQLLQIQMHLLKNDIMLETSNMIDQKINDIPVITDL